MIALSVVVPTHNPDPLRLHRTVAALRAQTVPAADFELVIVDNASFTPVDPAAIPGAATVSLRVVREPQLGLSHARRRGLGESKAEIIVLVDDDNVLAPDYLERARDFMLRHPKVGAVGGCSVAEFEVPPPDWMREFDDLIACRDLGNSTLVSHGLLDPVTRRKTYPPFAPIGAGMVLRRPAGEAWMNAGGRLTDRRGTELTSGGDNDIVLCVMEAGWEVAYAPGLRLTHLIPAARLQRDYLARLNRGIARSWIEVLSQHGACPWGPIPPWTVPLRKLKAWFSYRAWAGPAHYIRFQGACGHFEGRALARTR